MPLPLPTPVAPLLPHRPPIVMLDTLVENSPTHKTVTCVIRPDNRFLNSEGILDSTVIPELVAQGAAASYTHSHDGEFSPGFLAMARDIRILREIRVHDELVITATDESPLDGWFVIQFEIRLQEGTLCAKGEISVCQLSFSS